MATQPTPAAQRATARLRLRQGAPSTAAPRVGTIEPGTTFQPIARVAGEVVHGNAAWYALAGDQFVWSGASVEVAVNALDAAEPSNMDVPRRPDNGHIAVLSETERKLHYGDFPYSEGAGGRIIIAPAWTKANIVQIDTPLLADQGYAKLTVHKKAAAPFRKVFEKIEAAGLAEKIRTCAGTFVPRHMGWDPARKLSSHSWGIAIDINVAWNPYGGTPAPLGAIGSVRELIPLFESEGFAWGGYFTPLKYCDGMHFELARRDLG
jgi:hypothetical protein